MPLMQQKKQNSQEPDLIGDLPNLKKELKSKNINTQSHLGNVHVRLMQWIEKTNPEVAKELKELDKEDTTSEDGNARFVRGRSYNLAEFYLNLRKIGMEDTSAKWWISLLLHRPKGGLFSSPQSPVEKEYLTMERMEKMYDFVSRLIAVQKNPKAVDESLEVGWKILAKRSREYEKDNGSTGKNYINFLMEQLKDYNDVHDEIQTAGPSSVGEADREVYAVLKKHKFF